MAGMRAAVVLDRGRRPGDGLHAGSVGTRVRHHRRPPRLGRVGAGAVGSRTDQPGAHQLAAGRATVADAGSPLLTPSGTPDDSGLIAASPAASRTGTAAQPYELGGPAPVGSFVLGDSISLSAGVGPVLARLGYPVMGIVGQSASDTYLRTHLSGATAQAAPAWVIALGTNNTADPADVARLAGWVELIDSLRSPRRPPAGATG